MPGLLLPGYREIKDGEWYWVSETLIHEYGQKIRIVGIAVYNVLASMVNQNQLCFPSQEYIAQILGISRQSVNESLKQLEELQLIRKDRSRNHCVYRLLHLRSRLKESQMSKIRASDVNREHTNNLQLTRLNNNSVVSVKEMDLKEQKSDSRQFLLASDIAETVDDPNIYKFLPHANLYDEVLIREILSKVKQTRNIKKSRTALFLYLLKLHEKRT